MNPTNCFCLYNEYLRMDDERNSLNENYREFKENLKKGIFPKYDEFDLIEIFDVAADNLDFYVQTEVLLLGARLFPDSIELLQRRGFLYSSIYPDALGEFVVNNPQFDGMCWDILRLKVSGVKGADAIPLLDQIVRKYKKFDDEDIIRLSELIRELRLEEWLVKNVDLLEKKSEHADTLLYEVAMTQHDIGEEESTINILEKLTKIDPFRAENWILMAECYSNLGRYDDGLKAIDFARAVETTIPEADAIEASLLLGLEKDLSRAIALFEKYVAANPGAMNVIHNLILAYNKVGDKEKCQKLLIDLFNEDPANSYLLRELLSFSTDNAQEFISKYIKSSAGGDIVDAIADQMRELVLGGNYKSAVSLGMIIPEIYNLMGVVEFYLWALMLDNDWDSIIKFYDEASQHNDFFNKDSETLFYVAYACLQIGELERAKDLAVRGLDCVNKTFNTHLSFRMNQYGCQQALSTLIKLVDYGQADMIERFDPLLVKGRD